MKPDETQNDHDLLILVNDRTRRIEEMLEKGIFVTQAEFWVVKMIVYWGAGLVLLGVMSGLLMLVIKGFTGYTPV